MTKLLQIGQSSAAEIGAAHFGHIACTLGGVNYESTSHTIKGGSGCVRGSAARGAAHRLFKHQFFLLLSDAQAKAAQKYADGCVGEPYILGSVPTASHGGDCSGFVSGIICAAKGKPQSGSSARPPGRCGLMTLTSVSRRVSTEAPCPWPGRWRTR
jgi:hypothetical protein